MNVNPLGFKCVVSELQNLQSCCQVKWDLRNGFKITLSQKIQRRVSKTVHSHSLISHMNETLIIIFLHCNRPRGRSVVLVCFRSSYVNSDLVKCSKFENMKMLPFAFTRSARCCFIEFYDHFFMFVKNILVFPLASIVHILMRRCSFSHLATVRFLSIALNMVMSS